jgi:hypothetical protein
LEGKKKGILKMEGKQEMEREKERTEDFRQKYM